MNVIRSLAARDAVRRRRPTRKVPVERVNSLRDACSTVIVRERKCATRSAHLPTATTASETSATSGSRRATGSARRLCSHLHSQTHSSLCHTQEPFPPTYQSERVIASNSAHPMRIGKCMHCGRDNNQVKHRGLGKVADLPHMGQCMSRLTSQSCEPLTVNT